MLTTSNTVPDSLSAGSSLTSNYNTRTAVDNDNSTLSYPNTNIVESMPIVASSGNPIDINSCVIESEINAYHQQQNHSGNNRVWQGEKSKNITNFANMMVCFN